MTIGPQDITALEGARSAQGAHALQGARSVPDRATWLVRHRRDLCLGLVGAVLLLAILFAVRTMREIACRQELIREGFPDSYAACLAPLKADHSNWKFVPLKVDDLSWRQIVERECAPAMNLVPYSTWAPDDWIRYGVTNYTPYFAANAKAYDSGTWYQASREAIAYFMDPRNFFGEGNVFMFESLEYNSGAHTREAVERALENSFMSRANYDGGSRTFADLILEVGRETGTSPVFLAARLAIEQGAGTVQGLGRIGDSLIELSTNETGRVGNKQVWGQVFTHNGKRTRAVVAKGAAHYNGYYNLFNSGAGGNGLFEIRYNAWREATGDEVCRKYHGPWTSQEKALRGGALKIRERYIDTHRYTRYFQKFSVVPAAGESRWKQYMQNITAPLKESRNTRNAYDAAGTLDAPYRFVIPIYRDMPARPCPDPAKGRSTLSP